MALPAADYQRLRVRVPPKVHEGMDGLAWGLTGFVTRRRPVLRKLMAEVMEIDGRARHWQQMSDDALRAVLVDAREAARRGRQLPPEWRTEAMGAIREAAERTIGLRPYPVQLAGALALEEGLLCEMATGEGKTLTAALAAVFAGWKGDPCHVITVNDYLAERDARWFAKLYSFCGVSVGRVLSAMEPTDRQTQYSRDVVYTTSKEVVADFLRDRLKLGRVPEPERRLLQASILGGSGHREALVGRSPHTAIVDEADSVLIDEAVTPLIICQPQANPVLAEAVALAAKIADNLVQGRDYEVNERYKEVDLLPHGESRIAELGEGLPVFWAGLARRRELIEMALSARIFYQRGHQYVIDNGEVVIIDEATGRLMPNRTWREGLHQAVEAREGLTISDPTEILARLSFQRYFRLYRKLSGMTGTAAESAAEFWQVYGLPVLSIPPNRASQRIQLPTRSFVDQSSKWEAIVAEILEIHGVGRPVLVGTRSVESSENLASELRESGVTCDVLNAVRHAEEARIIEHAGERGRVTIATNMAGRGTDILLRAGVASMGGLHVICAEPNESTRIDRQLFGRAGRQGAPGSARAFVSLDDALIQRFVPKTILIRSQQFFPRSSGASVSSALTTFLLRYARRAAHRLASVQRSNVLRTDKWLDDALAFTGRSKET